MKSATVTVPDAVLKKSFSSASLIQTFRSSAFSCDTQNSQKTTIKKNNTSNEEKNHKTL